MTIGIAARGPGAAAAVLAGLAMAERVGRGAIGGFVSLVALDGNGRLVRAETQRGGSAALFPGGSTALFPGGALPEPFAETSLAALMSSGPDRPAPLSRFTPADPAAGLVTGHRFPNGPGADGRPLNEAVLDLLRRGLGPAEAVERVIADNPAADAGFIALTPDGRIHAADTPRVAAFPDAGRAILAADRDPGITVAVLHNAIHPRRGLATLVAGTVLDALEPPEAATGTARLGAGIPVLPGEPAGIHVVAGAVVAVSVPVPAVPAGTWHFGYGPRAAVLAQGRPVGIALYEPYLVAEGGVLRSADGQATLAIPVRLDPMPVSARP